MISLTKDRQSRSRVYHSIKGIPPGENGILDKPIRYLGTAASILASFLRLEAVEEMLASLWGILLGKDGQPSQNPAEGKGSAPGTDRNGDLRAFAKAGTAVADDNRRLVAACSRKDEKIAFLEVS
jgi:hypothetical protein